MEISNTLNLNRGVFLPLSRTTSTSKLENRNRLLLLQDPISVRATEGIQMILSVLTINLQMTKIAGKIQQKAQYSAYTLL